MYCHGMGLVNALGINNAQVIESLRQQHSGLKVRCDWLLDDAATYLGAIEGPLPEIPPQFKQHNTRNNQILLACLKQIEPTLMPLIERHGSSRIAVVMGTSTSGIAEAEQAVARYVNEGVVSQDFHYQYQRLSDPSAFLCAILGLTGPSYTISTACSSSAKAVISGVELLKSGMADVALVGGADSLCKMAINGFNALESISQTRCQPFSKVRNGINIGEGGGLMILSKTPADIAILGTGTSSDAWHISAPHPEGVGAHAAMSRALAAAQLSCDDVGYINLHGTATPLNDRAESKAVYGLFKDRVPASSTKHLTGHTLGAAGITDLGLCYLILREGLALPRQKFSRDAPIDDSLDPISLVTTDMLLKRPIIVSNSFAFGGNNASLIIGNPNVSRN